MAFNKCRLIFLNLLPLIDLAPTAAFEVRNLHQNTTITGRERFSLNKDWRFFRTTKNTDNVIYDHRTDLAYLDGAAVEVLKPYILPAGNDFIKNAADQHARPAGNPGSQIPYVQSTFDDGAWEKVNLPHDWAIKGPFYVGNNVPVSGGMGRLPVQGIGWYRQKLRMSAKDKGKVIYLDIDGAQSYAMVWLNGQLVGGWPYGYASFRLDLTPYLKFDGDNQLAIRLDNPTEGSRWYPGGGIYRNVWLTKVDRTHVAQWGTYVTTDNISQESATVKMVVQVENKGNATRQVEVVTEVHDIDSKTQEVGEKVAEFKHATVSLAGNGKQQINQSVAIQNPSLWGPAPTQQPNMYVAITRLSSGNMTIDTYETRFGIRSFTYDADKGLLVNGQHVRIQGVNQHHDLGSIGAAFNDRAAQRQLEILHEMGCNAIRMSHNPPAPELLEMTDRMGFLVMDEIFDSWQQNKTANDFHLIFNDWHEPDLRAFIRRDRNHPSIFAWSIGNEVGEQHTDTAGAEVAKMLHDIAHDEDPTRLITASMNYAKPNMPFPRELDIISLNYQGEGIRDAPAYAHLPGIKTSPLYPSFHSTFPGKMILSSETAAALSTRGTFIFPVTNETSAPVNDTSGGNSTALQVSAYELYSADFGSSPDKVFSSQDHNLYVAGEFVWSGFDYLGEPTPYYSARSSYFGPIDLAGFPKDRFYLYQSRWRPDLRMAHILPHWTWPDRVGKVTPVHVFSAADEAELFVNGKSQGRNKRAAYEYRFRWDQVVYEAGELHVVTFRNGTKWADATMKTAGAPAQLRLTADRSSIAADGVDLSFITAEVLDKDGIVVPTANDQITFDVSRAGDLVSTDNGDPADFVAFGSKTRKAFNGLALGVVKGKEGGNGEMTVTATAGGLKSADVTVEVR